MLKRLAITAAAVLLTLPSAAQASPRTGTFQDHQELWAAIVATGTETRLNTATCFGEDAPDGYYAYDTRGNSEFVVCQDGAVNATQVEWTENDLDTLRHEAVHLIQDCQDGRRADGRLSPIGSDEDILRLVDATIGREHARRITQSYMANGMTDPNALMTEVEAFAAAASVHADTLSEMIYESCATL